MSVEWGQIVFGLLTGDETVSGLVGTSVFPNVAPQDSAAPYIVYQLIDAVPVLSLSGFTSDLRSARIQVDCYHTAYESSVALGNAAEAVMESIVESGFSCLELSRRELFEGEVKLYRVSMDFKLWSIES